MKTIGWHFFAGADSQTEQKWLSLRLGCALIWALELFWLQKLAFPAVPWIRYPFLIQGFRLWLDVILAVGLVLALRGRFLIPLLVLNFVWMLVFGSYSQHFHRPLMPLQFFYQSHEAWSLLPQLWEVVSPSLFGFLLLAGALKLALVIRSGEPPVSPIPRLKLTVALALAYVVTIASLQMTHLTLNVRPNAGNSRNVFAYGYGLPWLCDLIGNRGLAAHAQQAAKLADSHFDRLSAVEAPIQIGQHLIILQLETVSGKAIEARCDDQLVMPFLHELKSRSMYFRLAAFHFNGSCDMDYAATTFSEPYPNVVPYRLPGIKYTNSLPIFMKASGYKTYVFHGNAALFYERGPVMETLGFDGLFFKEQLEGKHLRSSMIGIRDADVFKCVLDQVAADKRNCIFAITLDTHAPFIQLEEQEKEIFREPKTAAERYLNSLRCLDKNLQQFVSQLPEGTTVMMYGDHTASLDTPEFKSDVVNGQEFVCCLIHTKGKDLAAVQKARDELVATNGTLNLLDMMSYLRFSIKNPEGAQVDNTAPETMTIAVPPSHPPTGRATVEKQEGF